MVEPLISESSGLFYSKVFTLFESLQDVSLSKFVFWSCFVRVHLCHCFCIESGGLFGMNLINVFAMVTYSKGKFGFWFANILMFAFSAFH